MPLLRLFKQNSPSIMHFLVNFNKFCLKQFRILRPVYLRNYRRKSAAQYQRIAYKHVLPKKALALPMLGVPMSHCGLLYLKKVSAPERLYTKYLSGAYVVRRKQLPSAFCKHHRGSLFYNKLFSLQQALKHGGLLVFKKQSFLRLLKIKTFRKILFLNALSRSAGNLSYHWLLSVQRFRKFLFRKRSTFKKWSKWRRKKQRRLNKKAKAVHVRVNKILWRRYYDQQRVRLGFARVRFYKVQKRLPRRKYRKYLHCRRSIRWKAHWKLVRYLPKKPLQKPKPFAMLQRIVAKWRSQRMKTKLKWKRRRLPARRLRRIAFKAARNQRSRRVYSQQVVQLKFKRRCRRKSSYLYFMRKFRSRLRRSNPRGWSGPAYKRRRRGKRLFAGFFKKQRYRVARRDKFFFKRTPIRIRLVYRAITKTLTYGAKTRALLWRRRRTLPFSFTPTTLCAFKTPGSVFNYVVTAAAVRTASRALLFRRKIQTPISIKNKKKIPGVGNTLYATRTDKVLPFSPKNSSKNLIFLKGVSRRVSPARIARLTLKNRSYWKYLAVNNAHFIATQQIARCASSAVTRRLHPQPTGLLSFFARQSTSGVPFAMKNVSTPTTYVMLRAVNLLFHHKIFFAKLPLFVLPRPIISAIFYPLNSSDCARNWTLSTLDKRVAVTYNLKNFLDSLHNQSNAVLNPHVLQSYTDTRFIDGIKARWYFFQLAARSQRLRLSETTVTRANRRRSGLAASICASVEKLKTQKIIKNKLLLPFRAVTRISFVYRNFLTGGPCVSALPTKYQDLYPRFPKRRFNFAKLKAVYLLRYRHFIRALRKKRLIQRRCQQLTRTTFKSTPLDFFVRSVRSSRKARTLYKQNNALALWSCKHALLRSTRPRRVISFLPKSLSNNGVLGVALQRSGTVKQRREQTLWHARASRAVILYRRSFSAWSPKLPGKIRRKSYPRLGGVALPRKRISFKAARTQKSLNARLAARNLPQRRRVDYTAVKLQYVFGSNSSSGYPRLRRIYRPHTKHGRYVYPNVVAAPISRMLAQQLPSARLYYRRQLTALSLLKTYTAGHASSNPRRATTLRLKFPGRKIPWRNFKYKRPRHRDAPATLQRWAFKYYSGRTRLPLLANKNFVLPTTVRKNLNFEKQTSVAWGHHIWTFADSKLAARLPSTFVSSVIKLIPSSAWSHLRKTVNSFTNYSCVQRIVLAQVSNWIKKHSPTTTNLFYSVRAATAFLFKLIASLPKCGSLQNSPNRLQLYAQLEGYAFFAKQLLKKKQFWALRELPRIAFSVKSTNNPAAAYRSILRRKWLVGAERFLHFGQRGYTVPNYGRYFLPTSVTFGRPRARFPASGKRRGGYETLLHSFVKKSCFYQLRRINHLRFKVAVPSLSKDFRINVLLSFSSVCTQRRVNFASRLTRIAYLSSTWRQLLATPLGSSLTPTCNKLKKLTKRRFAATINYNILAEYRYTKNKFMPTIKSRSFMLFCGVVRRALRRRRNDRAFAYLYKSVLSRRLPKEQALSWNNLRRIRRRKLRVRAGVWNLRSLFKKAPTTFSWTLSTFNTVSPRVDALALRLPMFLPSGERLLTCRTVIKRAPRAFFGFNLRLKGRSTRRKHRTVRDSKKRCRGYRRKRVFANFSSVMRRLRHWSEHKSTRVAVNTVLSHRKKTVRRFFKNTSSATNLRHVVLRRFNFVNAPQPALRTNSTGYGKRNGPTSTFDRQKGSTSAARHFGRLKTYKKNKIIKRWVQQKKLSFNKNLIKKSPAAAQQFYKLVANFSTQNSATMFSPTNLHFRRPANIALQFANAGKPVVKDLRHKRTAQYAESLAAYIPALMNHIISKKITVLTKISYTAAQYLIRNIYWSLRIYLNVDPFDERFIIREQKPTACFTLTETLLSLAQAQIITRATFSALRYRFQPGKMPRALSTKRFRSDWLRAFFPEKHALYQEDPDDYNLFLFSTKKIRRLRIGGSGMRSWRTARSRASIETSARQLLTLRYTSRAPRLETFLQTSRRHVWSEKTIICPTNTQNSHFFVRFFSTKNLTANMVAFGWLARRKRFVSFSDKLRTFAPAFVSRAKRGVIVRADARGATNYGTTIWGAVGSTPIDVRFSRQKSPRSKQYAIRTSAPRSKNYYYNAKLNLRGALRQHTPELQPQYRAKSPRRVRFYGLQRAGAHSMCNSTQLYPSQNKLGACTHPFYLTVLRINSSTVSALQQTPLQQKFTTSTAASLRLKNYSRCPKRTFLKNCSRFANAAKKYNLKLKTPATKYFTTWTLLPSAVKVASTLLYAPKRINKRRAKLRPLSFKIKRYRAQNIHFVRPTAFSAPRRIYRGRTVSYHIERLPLFGATDKPKLLKLFSNGSGYYLSKMSELAYACAAFTRVRQHVSFDTYRTVLWNKLTLRWKKKFRFGRYWLRDTSKWLKDPWLSEIVACDMSLRPDKMGGELRSREQQIGEYVPEVDAFGRDIPEAAAAHRERHTFQPRVRPTHQLQNLKKKAQHQDPLVKHRLRISKIARRKPVPSMWLANYEFYDVIREYKVEKAKSPKQKQEEAALRVKEYWARKLKKLPEEKPRRAPLKHPANHWLPRLIWNEIQRRVRRLEWRESDEIFFRKGFRNAFQFSLAEKSRIPWLENLMYTRATYSTRLREFRRRQFPHEQKKYKWLQRVRKFLYSTRQTKYLRWRRWPQLRRYNQKLHYSLFSLRGVRAARHHFAKLKRRTRPPISNFVSATAGLSNRLDVSFLRMGLVPTIYWARVVSTFCLLSVNGRPVRTADYLLQPGDTVQLNWDAVARFQHFFKPYLYRRAKYLQLNNAVFAGSFDGLYYHPGTRTLVYTRPSEDIFISKSDRLQPTHFKWFRLDSA